MRDEGGRSNGVVIVIVGLALAGVATVVAALAFGGDVETVSTTPAVCTTSASSGATTTTPPTESTESTEPTEPTESTESTTVPEPTGTPPSTAAATVPPTASTPVPGARIQVKFAVGSGVRLRDGALVSETGADLTAVDAVLARYPGTVIERLFLRPEADLEAERLANEARTGQPQPDLNLYYRLTLPAGFDGAAAIADLEALAIVDRAYPDPVAAPPPAPSP
ncbi:MAG: hypothetical protein QOE93_728 [Actinomycetota bacterium]|nr:hypothetical protein [Actinomycetota bacterium]